MNKKDKIKLIKKVALKSNIARTGVPEESLPEINPVLDNRHL